MAAAAACSSESTQAAKRRRLDTDRDEDDTSAGHGGLAPPLGEETFVDGWHANKLLEGLNRLRRDGALCDVILCCEGQEFPCHRYVLAACSPYFEAMFRSSMKESSDRRVTIGGVEPPTVGLLLSYVYTSKLSITGANVQALLAASNLWDMGAVREACCSYMERHMDTSSCVGVFCLADQHCCEDLERHSLDYLLEHFTEVYTQEDFLSLSLDRLVKVLSSDHLNVLTEDVVFQAAMLWFQQDPTQRRHGFEKVLQQVRLPLISPSYRHAVSEGLEGLKDHKACRRFVSEARNRARTRGMHRAEAGGTTRPGRSTVIVTVDGQCSQTLYSYKMKSFDLQTKQWRTLGRLPTMRQQRSSVVMSGSTLYLTSCGDLWRYDVTRNSWMKLAPMNQTHPLISLVMLNSSVYAVGGQRDSIQRYEPVTNTWNTVTCVGVAAYCDPAQPCVVALDDLLYFIDSTPSSTKPRPPSQVSKYSPDSSSMLTDVSPMQTPRDHPAVCTLNGKMYLIGGTNLQGSTEKTVEVYSGEAEQWSACASMQEARCQPGVVLLADGRICVLGGRHGHSGFSNTMEVYSEDTDSWETVGQMPTARRTARYALNCASFRLRNDFVPEPDVDDDDDEFKEFLDYLDRHVSDGSRTPSRLSNSSFDDENDEDEDVLFWSESSGSSPPLYRF